MADSLIFTARADLTNPRPDTPILTFPDYASDLYLDFTFDYLRASVANNAAVTDVTSQAGSKPMTLSTTAPSGVTKPRLIHEMTPGGHAYLDFNASEAIASASGQTFEAGEPSTWVVLLRADSVAHLAGSGGNYSRVLSGAGGAYRILGVEQDYDVRLQTATGGNLTAPGMESGEWALVVATMDGDGATNIYVNDEPPVFANLVAEQHQGLYFGSNGSFALNTTLDGGIARVMAYGRVLSESDIAGLRQELRNTGWIA